jgi:hypothetical protein
MPDYDERDERQLEHRLRRALRWMAEEAEVPASSPRGLVGTAASRTSAGESEPTGEAGLYLDEPTSASPGRRAPRKLVLTAAAAIVLVAVGTSLALVASGGNTHGSQSGGTSGVPGSTDREQVVSALSATTSAGNWDVSYTYGEVSGSASTPTPTTTSCPASQNAVCIVTPGGGSVQDVTVTGTGIIDVNPKAMVADADVSDFGHVVLRVDSSQVWEILSGDSGGLAPDPGEEQTMGQSLPGYAGLVEGTLGTREGAVAMLGIASPTGYLELDEQAILGVTPAGTGTVDGQAVTQYKVSVQPSELASDPTASPQQVSAIRNVGHDGPGGRRCTGLHRPVDQYLPVLRRRFGQGPGRLQQLRLCRHGPHAWPDGFDGPLGVREPGHGRKRGDFVDFHHDGTDHHDIITTRCRRTGSCRHCPNDDPGSERRNDHPVAASRRLDHRRRAQRPWGQSGSGDHGPRGQRPRRSFCGRPEWSGRLPVACCKFQGARAFHCRPDDAVAAPATSSASLRSQTSVRPKPFGNPADRSTGRRSGQSVHLVALELHRIGSNVSDCRWPTKSSSVAGHGA